MNRAINFKLIANAKELDNETSYTYFGARYYDSDLSSWLSVDPLSDKYPSLSPYCYSADNPVVLKDPNGMWIDDYSVDKEGNIKLERKTNDNFDRIYTKNSDGSLNETNYVQLEKNSIIGTVEVENIIKKNGCSRDIVIGKGEGYRFKNEKIAKDVYFFLAENTKVEFGFINTKNNGSVVFTNHHKTKINAANTAYNMSQNGETITEISHSHPYFKSSFHIFSMETFIGPSDEDMMNYENFNISHNNKIDYWIYEPHNKQKIYYDNNSIYYKTNKNCDNL